MDAVENQKRVSHRAHSPWKSLRTRFPHSPSPDDAVEKWKANPRLPTFPLPYDSYLQHHKKGGLAAVAHAPSPGSFLDENMLFESCLRVRDLKVTVCGFSFFVAQALA